MTGTWVCRISIIIIGVAVLGIGLHSHFQSAWVASLIRIPGIGELKPYQMCDSKLADKQKCPPISYERFYISVIFACFLISVISFIISLLCNTGSKPIRVVDVIYHVVASVVLIGAAALYILSAVQINDMIKWIDSSHLNFRSTEKIIAGGLTMFQGILCFISAIVIASS